MSALVRVVGTDPGTSSLDLLLLADGVVVDQARLTPEDAPARSRTRSSRLLRRWGPIDLVAGPSGYGLPLVRAERLDRARPRRRCRSSGPTNAGVGGRRPRLSLLGPRLGRLGPAGRLPARGHPPAHDPRAPQGQRHRPGHGRQGGRRRAGPPGRRRGAVARTSPSRPSPSSSSARPSRPSWSSSGAGWSTPRPAPAGRSASDRAAAWDGEVAYWRSPLSKDDLFRGGLLDLGPDGPRRLPRVADQARRRA